MKLLNYQKQCMCVADYGAIFQWDVSPVTVLNEPVLV